MPVVAVVWLVGHLLLWGSQRLIRSGEIRFERQGLPTYWPVSVVISLVGCGLASFFAILFIGRFSSGGQLLRTWNLLLLAGLLPHPVCFVGLLLRRPWSRLLAVLIAAGWSTLMVLQILEHLWRRSPIRPWEMGVAVSWIAGFGLLAWRLATSSAVRSYFATSDATKAE